MLAGCCVLSYARTQASRAQSSCEAELYALGSCAVEALQLASMLAEQGWAVEPPLVYSDSSSALTPWWGEKDKAASSMSRYACWRSRTGRRKAGYG